MDNHAAVRIVDGRTRIQKNFEAVAHGQRSRFAVLQQRLAFDELHDEVGQPGSGGAAVDQARDIGMFQAGQNLTLVTEAADD